MPHFDFARPGGQWPQEAVPTATDWQRWDVLQSKTIDGVNGGFYQPSSPIVIGGAGVALGGSSQISGGVTTLTGGRITITAAAGDFPKLGPARSYTLQLPNIIQQSASGVLNIDIPTRYMHDGARLATVGVVYSVPKRPTSVPTITIDLTRITNLGATSLPIPNALNTWSAITAYSVGNYVRPNNATMNGFYFKCTSTSGTGLSGASEPTPWPSVVGATITDNPGANQVIWTCVGRAGMYAIGGATVDGFFHNGQLQTLAFDFDGTTAPNIVDLTTKRYRLSARNFVTPTPITIVSAFAVYDTITSLQWQ